MFWTVRRLKESIKAWKCSSRLTFCSESWSALKRSWLWKTASDIQSGLINMGHCLLSILESFHFNTSLTSRCDWFPVCPHQNFNCHIIWTVAASPHESSGKHWNWNKCMENTSAESQERSKLTAEETVRVKDVTRWLKWHATQWRAAAVLGLKSWKLWK